MNSLQFPPFLVPGDTIIILSPASHIDPSFVNKATKILEYWGLHVIQSPHTLTQYAGYSATHKERLQDLQEAFDHPTAKAILCSRGGYGTMHLIDKLNIKNFSKHPKWLIGFSDITCIHSLLQHYGFASIHALMARHLAVEGLGDTCSNLLKDLLFGELPAYSVPAHPLNKVGRATGVLRGGNMCMLQSLRGTPYDFPANNTILFIEDVSEAPHAVERMLLNMKLAGILDKLSGLIIGQFTDYVEHTRLGAPLYEALATILSDFSYPICFNFPIGHVQDNRPMINGALCNLQINKKSVSLSFDNQE